MFSGFSDFRFLLQSTSKETKQLRQLNIFVLHVPVRCLITAKVSTHPLCWRPVCLCVCLSVFDHEAFGVKLVNLSIEDRIISGDFGAVHYTSRGTNRHPDPTGRT